MLSIAGDGSAVNDGVRDPNETRKLGIYGRGYDGILQVTGRALRFERDQEIYGYGNDADQVFKVEAGVVRTYRFLRDGRRQVDCFRATGEVFGLELGGSYTLSAAAACDCTVIAYRRRSLEKLAANNEQLRLQLSSAALSSLARAQEHSLSLGRRNAAERVAMFLIECLEYSNSTTDIQLAMPRRDIADYLGLTMETVSRTFSHFAHDSLIELVGTRRVRLRDTAGLRALYV
jgi:CRP/FNR family nitrogen fixation transcriptional regulator